MTFNKETHTWTHDGATIEPTSDGSFFVPTLGRTYSSLDAAEKAIGKAARIDRKKPKVEFMWVKGEEVKRATFGGIHFGSGRPTINGKQEYSCQYVNSSKAARLRQVLQQIEALVKEKQRLLRLVITTQDPEQDQERIAKLLEESMKS